MAVFGHEGSMFIGRRWNMLPKFIDWRVDLKGRIVMRETNCCGLRSRFR